MNSKGHLYVSISKSLLRIGGCIWALVQASIAPLAILLLVAEMLGILEELVDKR